MKPNHAKSAHRQRAVFLWFWLLLNILPVCQIAAQAQSIPTAMQFQGRLAKPDGTPVPDTNNQSLTFRLYDALSGGNRLWQQTLTNVPVRSGVFSVRLDFNTGYQNDHTFASVFSHAALTPFLEIQAGADTPLAPRQPLSSVPYAFAAGSALTVPDGSITGVKIAAGAITGDKIAAGTIRSSHLETLLQQPLSALSFTSGVPFLLGSVTLNFESSSVAIQGNFAYVTNQTGAGFQIIDITTPAAMVLRGSLNTTGSAGRALAVSGHYAYALDSAVGLSVIDIRNPDAPVLTGSLGLGIGLRSLALSETLAAITSQTTGTLFLVDVSNPGSPALVGSIALPSASGVAIAGNFAYVTRSASNTLSIVDISNPTAPVLLSSIGTGNQPVAVAVQGSFAYVLNQSGATMQIFEIGNPASPVLRGSVAAVTFPSQGRGIVVSGSHAYVAGGNRLQQFDIGAPAAPFLQSSLPLSSANGLALQGSTACVVGSTSLPKLLLYHLPPTGLVVQGNLQVTGDTLLSGTLDVGSLATFNNGLRVNGSQTLEFGAGISKETDAGKIGYQTLSSALDIVGAGTSASNRQVKIWAEGGTTFTGNINVNGTNYTSDGRYKTNIVTFDNALDAILNLRGVTFDWDREQWKERGFADGRQIGFIAQEVETILPELVSTDSKGYKSVAYANVVPVLVEAVKTLNSKVERLQKVEAENAALKAKNAELEARLERLEDALRNQK